MLEKIAVFCDRFMPDVIVNLWRNDQAMEPETRESLIARLPDHADSAAWEEFVQLYEPLIYGIGRRHGLQPSDATDLVQDVLIAVASCIDRFEPDAGRGRFRSWLFRVAKNQTLLRLRRLRHDVNATEQLEAIDENGRLIESGTGDKEFEMAFRRRAFRWAARRVRETVKGSTWEAFARTAIECQSPQDAAEELGMDIGAVYLARSRVMKRLRNAVENVSGEVPAADDESSILITKPLAGEDQ